MADAERSGVPLNNRCSRKWEAPDRSTFSSRDPVPTQNPMHTDRASAMASVASTMPDGSVSVRIIGSVPLLSATRQRLSPTAASAPTAIAPTRLLTRSGGGLGTEVAELLHQLGLEGVLERRSR